MEDYEFGDEGTSTKSKQSKLSKRVTANRPLDPKVTVKTVPTEPVQTQSEVEAATASATVSLAQEAVANSGMVKFSKAFQGAFGGYTADIVRALTKDQVNANLDPSWDVGTVRDEFRSKYGYELWDKFEGTRNRHEYEQYKKEADENMQREQDMSGSLGGSLLGSVFDLPSLIAGGGIVKGAQLAVRARQAGKYTALTGGAAAEAGLFGGIEAGLQYDEAGKVYDKTAIAQTMAITGALHFGIGAATTSKSWYEAATDAPTVRLEPYIGDIEGEAIKETNTLIGNAQRELADYSQRVADDLGLVSSKLTATDSRALKAEAKQLAHSLKYEAGIYDDTFKVLAKQAQGQGMSRKEAEAVARKTLDDKRLSTEARLETVQGRLDTHVKALQAEQRLNMRDNGKDLDTIYGMGDRLEFTPTPTSIVKAVDDAVESTDSAIADAGAAANTGRANLQNENIIESVGDGVTDWQDTLTRHADAVDARVGSKAYEWLSSPIGKASQFTSNTLRGFASSSRVVRAVTSILGEDATGTFRAGTSGAAIDKFRYNNQVRGMLAPIHDEMQSWAKRKGHGGMLGWTSTKGESEFNSLLRTEMEARWSTSDLPKAEQDLLDQARWANLEPEVKRAADAFDNANQFVRDLGEQHGLQGMAELAPVSRGYVSRRMDGKVLQALHRTDSAKYKQVLKAVAQRYHETIVNKQKQLQALGEEVKLLELSKAETIIEGLFKRAIDRASGLDGSTLGIVDRAAREEIRTILQSKGMDYSDIEHTFKLIDKRLGQSSGSNRLKGRMDIDISTPVRLESGENFNLVDLYDNNLHKLAYSYSEEMSGRIALARRGIGNDNDFEQILNAVRNENKSLEVDKDIELLRDMYAQMLGRPIKGQGENKVIQFLTQLNPLQSLGQVGWAQSTESSLAVARLGLGSALKMIPLAGKIIVGARKGLLNESDKLLLKDVEAWNGPIGEFWRTHRPSTDVMERLNVQGDTAQVVDKLLKTGQQINGYLSFMHQIMEAQLKAVAITGTRKFAQEIRAGKLTPRLADAGFSQESLNSIKRNLETHSAWNGDELADLQLDKWDFTSADEFTRNIERLSGQLIQRDFVGETASWMHKDMGRLLLSLRGYSVKAFNKQLVRNVKIGDAIAAQSVAIGLAFSALGYTAKMHAMSALREDKEEFLEQRLSGDSLVMGAVGYMALGSIGPELIRPLMSWAGEGDNEAGNIRSGGSALVALIPGLAPIDRAATVVTDIGKATLGDGDYGARQVRSLTQFFLGNSYPVGIALNATLDDSE